METRTRPTPTAMAYVDSMIGMFLDGGFSIDVTHHVLHTMGSRLMGFSQELFNDQTDEDQPFDPETMQQLGQAFPSISGSTSRSATTTRRWSAPAATTSSSSSSRST